MPIPILPSKPLNTREEWRKFFIYKKL